MHGRPHSHIFCRLVWNKELYNISRRQLGIHFFLFFEGCCIIFYFALKGPVVCQKARYTTSMQPLSSFIPFKTSQHEKLPWTNQRGRLEKPHHQSKLHREATEHVFWMKSLPKAMMQSLDNSIQSKECLLDRKFFGGKDETLKQQN